MSRILAIDTATEACSAAVLTGEQLIARYEEPGRGHSERILLMVDEVLKEAETTLQQVDGIAVGRGPGAFTGVRIAISIAQGLAFGAGKRVATVSDLAALAQRVMDERGAFRVVAAIDARMGELYWGVYEKGADGLAVLQGDERVSPAADVLLPTSSDWSGAGSGWKVEALLRRAESSGLSSEHLQSNLFPRAQEVARLGRSQFEQGLSLPPEEALPVYLRDQVAIPMSQKTRS